MASSEHARDAFTLHMRAALFPYATSVEESAAVGRIRQRLDHEILRTEHDRLAPGADRSRDRARLAAARTRARTRTVAIAIAVLVAITLVAVAAASSDAVREFFTADTPATHRMDAMRVSPTLGGFVEGTSAPVPDIVQQRLEQLYTADGDAMASQFGTLQPRATARELLHGRWNGRTVAIYARPTSEDTACYTAALGRGVPTTAHCFASYFDLDAPIKIGGTVDLDPRGATPAIRLFGLAADEVIGVTVRREDGSSSDALMGANAFYWDNLADGSPPERIEIHMQGDRMVVHPITRYVTAAPGP